MILRHLLIMLLISIVAGHGHLYDPCPRGLLAGSKFVKYPIIDRRAPRDYIPHFPAGDKNPRPGSALRSQRKAGVRWTPYEPTRRGFRFRAGVCGDLRWGKQHLRGGKYYHGGRITKTYVQGGILSASMALVTHHNGFVEFVLCDVAKCGGEISEKCLRNGRVCRKLKRAYDKRCETRYNRWCGPIDPKHPTRWYLPCRSGRIDLFGRGFMKFQLPKDMHCEHCVLQFYQVAANWCNPPGIVSYFRGPRGPKWGNCPGQGNAKGGYRPWNPCGGKKFPEEYYECADIRIVPRGGRRRPTVVRTPGPSKPRRRYNYNNKRRRNNRRHNRNRGGRRGSNKNQGWRRKQQQRSNWRRQQRQNAWRRKQEKRRKALEEEEEP